MSVSRILPRMRSIMAARAPAARFASSATHTIQSQTPPAPIVPSNKQAHPIGNFYQAMLDDPQPIPGQKPEQPPASAAPSAKKEPAKKRESTAPLPQRAPAEPSHAEATEQEEPPVPSPPPATAEEKARLVFGEIRSGPRARAERLAAARAKTVTIAGVLVPPRPVEPDNCCMSGCVNCVYDLFQEELEEWSAAKKEAEARLAAQQAEALAETEAEQASSSSAGSGGSMDDDGGGSEVDWVPQPPEQGPAKHAWDEGLYADIPVGIREFMKTEKRLKEQHRQQGTLGG
ncbi:hypothetical protein BN1708_016046 [Verticillium longisporum]|uniref:Oxidoreductase-like domain-containing protein n=1 Tax=Verticillium longisporum TaxID=100787 RepID=A0A0G4MCA5_VERLO|nr:hypothetical protein BN1708_016046 [Verticillium longisporum]